MSDQNAIQIKGLLQWGDTGAGVSNVVAKLYSNDGTTIGTAQVDQAGHYAMSIPAAMAGRSVFVVVSEPSGRIVHSTRDAAVVLQGTSCEFNVLVPGAPEHANTRSFEAAKSNTTRLREAVLEATEPAQILDIARSLIAVKPSDAAVVERGLAASLSRGTVETSLCGTPLLNAMEETIRARGWPREVAHQLDDILSMRDNGFATATYDSANFSVTYQTSGTAAVASSTASETVVDPGTTIPLATIGDGVTPTYILRVCFWLERALASYVAAPFSLLNPAATGKIPVVINTSPYGSASTSGTFYLNNNLHPDLICAVGVHELFHMVQFKYALPAGAWRSSVMEGGAVFAEDSAADKMNRYLDEAGSNFNGVGTQANPNLSLMSAGYKCCLFWRYIAEQQSPDVTEPFVGVETYRNIIEHCAAGSCSTDDIKAALHELPWYQAFYEYSYLDAARLDLTNSETMLGNYALACYLKDLGTNVPDRRFEFIEDEENIYIDEVVGGPAAATLASPTLSGNSTLNPTGPVAFAGNVNAFASRYYEVAVDKNVTNVEITFAAGTGLTSCLFQIVLIDRDGKVRDIHRTDRLSYTKRVANSIGGKKLSKVLVVVTGATTGGAFSISVSPAAPAPNVMVTRWHSVAGTEYEIDSRNWAWTWVSPDVWVDNDGNGIADGVVYFDHDNKLNIRLHNKGNAEATGIQVDLYYQDASPGLSDAAWKRVKDVHGVPQILTGLTLAAESTNKWVANWAPPKSLTSNHFCVRVVVTVPGDPNTDNKRAVSNFGCVKVKLKDIKDILLVLKNAYPKLRPTALQVIPRLGSRLTIKISARDVQDLLRGGEEEVSTLRLSVGPAEAPRAPAITLPTRPFNTLAPDLRKHHATDSRALPPGVAKMPMVTVAATGKGGVIGGFTFLIVADDEPTPK